MSGTNQEDDKRNTYNLRELIKLNRLERWTLFIDAVIIVVLLLVVIVCAVNYKEINTIYLRQCETPNSPRVDFTSCNDFNPCTLDLLTTFPGAGCSNPNTLYNQIAVSDCPKYGVCQSVPLADGSCCNTDDFCYEGDTDKLCSMGVCKPSDYTRCKGYCQDVSECPTLPWIINNETISTQCWIPPDAPEFGSCVYLALVGGYVGDPYSLLDLATTLDYTNLQIGSCLSAQCTNYFLKTGTFSYVEYTECAYQWTCAPYIYPVGPLKKRNENVHILTSNLNTTRGKRIGDIWGVKFNPLNPRKQQIKPSDIPVIDIHNESTYFIRSFPYMTAQDEIEMNRQYVHQLIHLHDTYQQSLQSHGINIFSY